MSDTAKPDTAKPDTIKRATATPGMSDRSDGDLMSRRTVIGAAAATVAAGAAQAAEPRVKGPRVWLDMDQKELDDAYDQSVYAPNRDQMSRRRVSESERVRAVLGEPRRVAYGDSSHEMLDIYPARNGNGRAPIAVFVHGGAWRAGTARDSSYGAEPFVRAGAHFIVLDFIISSCSISSTRRKAAAT
jgi:arylformamidase